MESNTPSMREKQPPSKEGSNTESNTSVAATADGDVNLAAATDSGSSSMISDSKPPSSTTSAASNIPKVVVKKKRKVKYKKPQGAPSRPLSAYNFFFKEERLKWLAEQNNQKRSSEERSNTFRVMGKAIGGRWKKLPHDDRKKYVERAEIDLQRYRAEMEDYKNKQILETALGRSAMAQGVAMGATQRVVNQPPPSAAQASMLSLTQASSGALNNPPAITLQDLVASANATARSNDASIASSTLGADMQQLPGRNAGAINPALQQLIHQSPQALSLSSLGSSTIPQSSASLPPGISTTSSLQELLHLRQLNHGSEQSSSQPILLQQAKEHLLLRQHLLNRQLEGTTNSPMLTGALGSSSISSSFANIVARQQAEELLRLQQQQEEDQASILQGQSIGQGLDSSTIALLLQVQQEEENRRRLELTLAGIIPSTSTMAATGRLFGHSSSQFNSVAATTNQQEHTIQLASQSGLDSSSNPQEHRGWVLYPRGAGPPLTPQQQEQSAHRARTLLLQEQQDEGVSSEKALLRQQQQKLPDNNSESKKD